MGDCAGTWVMVTYLQPATTVDISKGETFLISVFACKGACVQQAASSCCPKYFSRSNKGIAFSIELAG